MPRNGSGDFQLVTNSWQPAVNGVLATAGDWQSLINDVASALTQSVSRDGQSPLTGNLDLGNNKINNVTAGTGTGQALAFQQLFDQGVQADIASAATTDIGAQNTNFLRVTGTTTITSFGSNFKGPRFLVFAGAVTLTNSSTLVLPGGANITTAAGDVLIAIPGATLGTADKWIVTAYQKNAVPGAIADGSVTTAKLANNAITPEKLANGGLELGGFRNRLINANPIINQRGYVSGTATSGANQYTLDRWRVVTSGQNVSWTDSGLTRTLTCPAGGLEQVIESLNIEGGTFVLNWTGTATATVNGTAVLKGGTFTLPANTNATVKFSSGTLSNPQLEAGSVATPFERRDYGRELMMCQRYFEALSANASGALGAGQYITLGVCENTTRVQPYYSFKVQKRVAPSTTLSTISSFGIRSAGSSVACSSGAFGSFSTAYAQGEFNNAGGGLVAGGSAWLTNHTGAATIEWSAEL
jgi:hypothetical protein